jgi:hypothetical protein
MAPRRPASDNADLR